MIHKNTLLSLAALIAFMAPPQRAWAQATWGDKSPGKIGFVTARETRPLHPGSPVAGGDQVPSLLEGNSFVIRNVRVFDGERVLDRVNVVVKAGLIISVGRGKPPADLPGVEGSGRTLLPGFIDAHAHVQNDNALRHALRFGVTTQLDMFTRVAYMQGHKADRDRLGKTDMSDLYSAGAPVTSPGGMGTQFGIPFPTIAGPTEASAFVRARLAEGSDYIKVLYEPSAGFVTTISKETLTNVIAAAHAQGALAVIHISSLEGARAAVAAGADGLVHIFADAPIDDALLANMSAKRVFVTPTLSIFAAIDGKSVGPSLAADARLSPFLTDAQRKVLTVAPQSSESGEANPMGTYLTRFKIDMASANVRRLRAAGVRILAGDDVPNLASYGVSMHGELKLLTSAGLSPVEALRAATRAPAEAFALKGRGRIIPGARADILLVEGNPTKDIEATRAIVRVFKNGFEVSRKPPMPKPAG
jgi:imidazolonepropionase-like amidohydrolase